MINIWKMKTILLSFLSTLLFSVSLFATHNLAGEIQFRQTGPLEIEVSIYTYTVLSSFPADRDSLVISWGDGTFQTLVRNNGDNGNGEIVAPNIKRNRYQGTHLYAIAGQYTLSMTDPNRNGGILNVNYPNSENIQFHIEAVVTVSATPGGNKSPALLEMPYGVAILGQPYYHFPNAFDPDGDSLAYELIIPLMGDGEEIPNYAFPDQINPGPMNQFYIDSSNGLITWDSPQQTGLYTYALKVSSYRDGVLQDVIIRDIQITVYEDEQLAPTITLSENNTEDIIDVAIGDTVMVTATATENFNNINGVLSLNITASCALLEDNYFDEVATYTSTSSGSSASGTFFWVAKEEHARQEPYQLVFRASDGYEGEGVSRYAILRYRVLTSVTTQEPSAYDFGVQVFPNPASSSAQLMIETLLPNTQLIITNSMGQLIHQQVITNTNHTIETANWPSGSYFLQVTDGVRQQGRMLLVR
jgi:hypothetical protein